MSTTMTHERQTSLDKDGRKRIVFVFVFQIGLSAIIFLGAGTLNWPIAWAHALFSIGTLAIGAVIIIRKSPGIINERGRTAKDTKPFDKLFTKLYAPLVFLIPLIVGLDYRFDWSTMPVALQVIGFICLIPGIFIIYWAMSVNYFLTTTVRIQTNRGHQVCTSGPYQYVRHPMYSGFLLSTIGLPLMLGSWWGLLLAFVGVALFVWRTSQEDKMLQAELSGYVKYSQETHYRLLPGVW
ncbi:MAG: isoprenylcysteine carboxylmethyltransferase family protein [Chloroflexi bacterium]|nr:isoprenylcysteine carboxylmethyltransferase family protein [Chloroflexota bacterium]